MSYELKKCPICGKQMEPDVIDEYEEGDTLFCFDCGITDNSLSYFQAKREKKEHKREYYQEIYGENWEDIIDLIDDEDE